MVCGVIDIGANSIRLSIYSVEENAARLLLNKKETAGLASYVKNRKLSQKGVDKACAVLNDFKNILTNLNITSYYAFATASLRNIANTEEAILYIRAHTDIRVDVLSGEEEAMLGFAGAVRESGIQNGMMIDVGGGSTEVVGFRGVEVTAASSMPVGSLNLFTKHVKKLLPSEIELRNISIDIIEQLVMLHGYGIAPIRKIIGIGGTVRAAAKLGNEYFGYPEDCTMMRTEEIGQILKHYRDRDGKVMKTILLVAPERVHTLIPGLDIMFNVAQYFGAETIIANKYSIREGYVNKRIIGGDSNNAASKTAGDEIYTEPGTVMAEIQ